ncbi:inositol monophosphatase family protein [Nocardia sp. NPDC004711]
MTDYHELLGIARAAVAEGCKILSTSRPGSVHAKGDRDFVTDLDVRIQEAIRDLLADATPEIGFLGEENASNSAELDNTEYRWILDPIDGTSNFIHEVPLCAVSLGLVLHNDAVLGVIGAPFLNLEYYAAVGHGAFANDQRITASSSNSLAASMISIGDYAVGLDAQRKNHARLALTTMLASRVERIRMLGSAALDLAWVAEGRTDACVLLTNKPWDMAAGVVIAKESGAVVTDSDGSPHNLMSAHTLAAAPLIADEFLDLVAQSLAARTP